MDNNPVGWFEIYVQDMARARAFYEGVFEGKLQKMESVAELWAFPMSRDGAGSAGALIRMPGFPSGQNSVIVYFRCQDCGVEEDRVKRLGGRVEKPKMRIGEHGFVSLVYDTEGNMIGLHSMK